MRKGVLLLAFLVTFDVVGVYLIAHHLVFGRIDMPALGGYITAIGNQATAAFAMPLLLIAMVAAGAFWATGNRGMAQSFAIGGLIGVGLMLAAPAIVASLPRPA